MAETATRRAPRLPFAGAIGIFLLGGILATLLSYDPALSFQWLIWLVAGTLLYALITLFARSYQQQVWLAGVYVLIGLGIALVLITQYQYLYPEVKFSLITRLGRLLSAAFPRFVTPGANLNFVAAQLEGILPIAIGLLAVSRSWWRALWAGSALLIGLALVLTASRGSWVALAIGAGTAIAIHARQHTLSTRIGQYSRLGRILIGAGIAGLILVVVAIGVAFVEQSLSGVVMGALIRAADRLVLYRNSFFLALDFPFTGIGGGEVFAQVYSSFQLLITVPFLYYAHNLFLCVWLAQGLLGLMGLFGLILGAQRLFWRAVPQLDQLGIGAVTGCVIMLLHGFTDAPQYYDGKILLGNFAIFALAVAIARRVDARPLRWIRLTRAQSLVCAGAALVGLILAGPALIGRVSANIASLNHAHARLAPNLSVNQREELLEETRIWLDRALQYAPNERAAYKARGLLDLNQTDFGDAIVSLERAMPSYPDDQSIYKALGYAYVWYGYPERGVPLLRRLDRQVEVRGELDIWQRAWADRNRPELIERAREAAELMDR